MAALLERRRAAREQRRQEQQRQNEAEQQSSSNDATNDEPPSQDDTTSNAGADGTQNQPSLESNTPNDGNEEEGESAKPNEEEGAKPSGEEGEEKPKSLTEEELKAKQEKEIEEKSAEEAKQYSNTLKESLCKTCLDVIERSQGSGSAKEDMETQQLDDADKKGTEDSDSQGVLIVVVSNFLLEFARGYPDLEPSIASELLDRLKSNLDVQSPQHCRVKAGCENTFASLAHASSVIFRALPKSRPLVLRRGLVGCIIHCVRSCTIASSLKGKDVSETPMVFPKWLASALLLLEIMAQPTSVTLVDGEEAGESKPANKKSEYGKVQSVRIIP